MPSVVVRIFIGSLLLLTSCGLLALDYWQGFSYGIACMVALTVVGSAYELFGMYRANDWEPVSKLTLVALALCVLSQLGEGEWGFPYGTETVVVTAYVFLLMIRTLFWTPEKSKLQNIMVTLFTFAYLWILGRYVMKIRYLPDIGHVAIFYMVLATKGTDIFAYFTGKYLGSTPIIPEISPKKTVAGFIGGTLGCVGTTLAFMKWTVMGIALTPLTAVGTGLLVGVTVQAGDWVESFIKRSTEVKDSGSILPEYGGFLDVIDCIIIGSPVIYYLLYLSLWLHGGTPIS